MNMQPNQSLSFDHIIRPANQTNGPTPALFLLHGYGSNEEDLFSFTPELPQDLFVISIRAPHSLQPFGYAWYSIDFNANRGKWNDVGQAIESREAVLGFIEEAIPAYNLDSKRINLLGFSQGTILSYAMALSYPERFKCLIGLSGYIDPAMLLVGFESKSNDHLNIYASHGQLDMVIPPEWAQQASVFLEKQGLEHRYEEFPVGHGVSPENFRSFLKWLEGRY